MPGGPELLVILFIAVLLFGANKIPKLARSSGEAIGEFQKGREEVEQELEEMREGASVDAEDLAPDADELTGGSEETRDRSSETESDL
ncbi:MAG: twin-arginine translocase TatA/TatE family subunit [Haloarculaceae archaeon]